MGTRRHGDELEAAIAEAVRAELVEKGYTGTTFEGVAARAGTSKPVLYRRWSTKSEMVLDALLRVVPTAMPCLDTGDMAGDLKALLCRLRDLFDRLGRDIILHLMAELPKPAMERLESALFTRRSELLAPIIERARMRGELGDRPVSRDVSSLPFDLVRHEILVVGGVTDERIGTIVENVAVPVLTAVARAKVEETR